MNHIIKYSMLIAFGLSLVMILLGDVIFIRGGKTSIMTEEEWRMLDDMLYKDAINYINNHSKEKSHIETIIDTYKNIYFLKVKFKHILFYFISIFIGCLLLDRLQIKHIKKQQPFSPTTPLEEEQG